MLEEFCGELLFLILKTEQTKFLACLHLTKLLKQELTSENLKTTKTKPVEVKKTTITNLLFLRFFFVCEF